MRGKPAPQGSKRAVKRKDGGVSLIESSVAVKPWRDRIATETQSVVSVPLPGAVYVRVWFMLKRPASHYRTGKNAHILRDGAPARPATVKRNDIDKLTRAVLDGLTDGGAWKDDGQVVDLRVSKHYADRNGMIGCKIEITEVAE